MIRMTVEGLARVRRDLQALMLPPRRKARVLKKMAGHVTKASKARITRQESLQGGKFAPRKPRRDDDRKAKRKLLLGFRRRVQVRLQGDTAVIYVSSGKWGARARQHQEGFTQVVKPSRLRLHRASPEGPGQGATRRQARRLKELGWRWPQKKIMATYSRKLAGFLIRKEEGREPKRSWRIEVPARPFLGASTADKAALLEILRKELRRGAA